MKRAVMVVLALLSAVGCVVMVLPLPDACASACCATCHCCSSDMGPAWCSAAGDACPEGTEAQLVDAGGQPDAGSPTHVTASTAECPPGNYVRQQNATAEEMLALLQGSWLTCGTRDFPAGVPADAPILEVGTDGRFNWLPTTPTGHPFESPLAFYHGYVTATPGGQAQFSADDGTVRVFGVARSEDGLHLEEVVPPARLARFKRVAPRCPGDGGLRADDGGLCL